jgi:hypothetical protein
VVATGRDVPGTLSCSRRDRLSTGRDGTVTGLLGGERWLVNWRLIRKGFVAKANSLDDSLAEIPGARDDSDANTDGGQDES